MAPDFRLRFPSPRIDFETDVGLTGTAIDDYPAPGEQARYDWHRLSLLALLTNQASSTEPTVYGPGSLWFDLNDNTLKVSYNDVWLDFAEIVGILGSNLKEWTTRIDAITSGFKQEILFKGSSTITTNQITIPESLRTYLNDSSRVLIYVNGLLQDPTTITILSNTTIALDFELEAGDTFIVNIKTIPSSTFYSPSVVL